MSAVMTPTAGAVTEPLAQAELIEAGGPAQLRLAGITKTYAAKDGPVLSGIDLDVARGELLSLLGPSGCGKSTLLRLVAGFIRPEDGRIEIGGRDVTRTPTHRRGVGIVHQTHALWPHLTVAENVSFGLEMRKIKRAERTTRVMEMLELVGLGGFERRLPTELSGGQQQRVALARALVVQPEVLLLDEPLSSLDANLRVHLREEIRRIQRELRVTTVFVTHDREEAMAVSDRIVILDSGHIAQAGTATELYREPQSTFVMGFTGSMVVVDGVVGDGGVVSSSLGTMPSHGRCSAEPGSPVQLCVRPEDLRVDDATTADASLPGLVGRLTEVSFLGSSVEARIDLDDPAAGRRRVEVRLHPRQIAELPDPGSMVRLSVDPAHVHVFPC